MDDLPDEMLCEIFRHLEPGSTWRAMAAMTCWRWRSILTDARRIRYSDMTLSYPLIRWSFRHGHGCDDRGTSARCVACRGAREKDRWVVMMACEPGSRGCGRAPNVAMDRALNDRDAEYARWLLDDIGMDLEVDVYFDAIEFVYGHAIQRVFADSRNPHLPKRMPEFIWSGARDDDQEHLVIRYS